MTPLPGQTVSTPSRGSNAAIALVAEIPIRKIASLWYFSGSSPKPLGRSATMACSWAAVRTWTAISSVWSLKAFGSAPSISRLIPSGLWSELRITLPLAMYVTTSS